MAKSKRERRSSIRHMAADDAFSVLEALERVEQQERAVGSKDAADDDADTDEDPADTDTDR